MLISVWIFQGYEGLKRTMKLEQGENKIGKRVYRQTKFQFFSS